MSEPTQADKALRLLRRAGSRGVSPHEAQDEYGTMRLAAQVWELRQRGYRIATLDEKHRGGKHARYVLHEGSGNSPKVRYVACPRCGGHLIPHEAGGRACELCGHRVTP